MIQIKMEFNDIEDAGDILKLAEDNEEIDVIREKNFNGDITIIELYISAAINVITLTSTIINTLIKEKKISSLSIDGDKIDVKNVPTELLKSIIEKKLEEKNVE